MVTRKQLKRAIPVIAISLVCLGIGPEVHATTGATQLLVEVNGDSITSIDLDRILVQTHRVMEGDERNQFNYRALLDRLVNDRLLLQEAEMVGMESEPEIQGELRKQHEQDAMRAFAQSNFVKPEVISDEVVHEYFEEMYWRIQIRQVSVRSETEAIAIRDLILSGASMDSLAREISLDPRKFQGGLHNFKYWADVENYLRDVVKTLPTGALSEPFAFREAYGLIRIEKEAPANFDELPRFEAKILAVLKEQETNRLWADFVADLRKNAPVVIHEDVLARIATDSTKVFGAEFLEGSDDVLVQIGKFSMTESAMRTKLSHAAMKLGTVAFSEILDNAMSKEVERLVILHSAAVGGYFEDPTVLEKKRVREQKSIVDSYLGEIIASQITFNRTEFETFYQKNQERFRGEPKYNLGTITVTDRADAEDISTSLQGGADFGYIRKQHGYNSAESTSAVNWIALSIFSNEIQALIAPLEVGQASPVIATATGFAVFYVRDKRVGEVQPLEDVEMQIREVMFQNKFSSRLDEYLTLLKERSEIIRHEDQINAYFGGAN